MKKLFVLFIVLPVVMLAACAPQATQSTASLPQVSQDPPSGSVPPLTYNSIDEFIAKVNSLKEGYEQTWIEKEHNIDQIDWYYDFKDPVKDVELYSVDANSLSVELYYRDKEEKELGYLALEYLRGRDLNDPANEEEFLKNWRWPDAIDIMINGHKALKGERYEGEEKTGKHICNLYYWVENGTVIILCIPAWLLERYPEETFFDIQKVEIKKPDETN